MYCCIYWMCVIECEGDGNAGVGDGEVFVVSTGHEYVVHVVQVAHLTCYVRVWCME